MIRSWTRSGRAIVCVSLLGALPFAGSARAQPEQPVTTLSTQALVQLEAVYAEKSSRTEPQKKLDTALVLELRSSRGEAAALAVPRLAPAFERDLARRIEVDIHAKVSDALLREIEQLGGRVLSSFPQYDAIRAFLPLEGIGELIERADVKHIRTANRPVANKINTSQGDVAHRANLARQQLAATGSGVKVGVLSTAVDQLAALQASGDLPGVTVLPGQAGSGDSEGTAMLEIVTDLAPGAQLYFATGFSGEAAMASNVLALAAQGCKVIVDDVSNLLAPVFQDGLVAQAVNTVTSQGVAYFSSAANSGNLSSGQSGVWEGNYVAGATITGYGQAHNFGGGNVGDSITSAASALVTLQWSDPWGASANDYDLCVLDSTLSTLIGCSDEIQDGNDLPVEALLPAAQVVGRRLMVINVGGNQAARFLHLNTNRGRLLIGTSGQTSGHSAAVNAFSVAAVNVATAGGGTFTGGAGNPVRDFSSDGPRRIFYNANGTAITPGNFLATGGALRQKPDLAAADGVATASSAPGGPFNPFDGTSAAAPHAAAIAALMLSAKPTATLSEIRAALTSTALDIMAPGVDRDSGIGIIDARGAVGAIIQGPGGGPCVEDTNTACMLSGRFRVTASFLNAFVNPPVSIPGIRKPVTGFASSTRETAFFVVNDINNIELVIKMLDQGNTNAQGQPTIAVLYGLATPLRTELTITDTTNGASKTFISVANEQRGQTDFQAFVK